MPRVLDSNGRLKVTNSGTLTTKGDVQTYDTKATRLPVGANGYVLVADSTQVAGISWVNGWPYLSTKGDLSGWDVGPQRIPIGTNGQVLTADSTKPIGLKWAASAGTTLTTKGDVQTYDTAPQRLAVGADGTRLTADSTQATGLSWQHTREFLTAPRTYYVLTTGSDSNTGLVNTAGGAFLTIQKAVDIASMLDNGGNAITINVGNGTYTNNVTLKSFVGSGFISIVGNTSTPSSCLISTTSADCFDATSVDGAYSISGFKLQTTTAGNCVVANGSPTFITLGAMVYGQVAANYTHLVAFSESVIQIFANYTLAAGTAATGGSSSHMWASGGRIIANSVVVTLTGNVLFDAFINCQRTGHVEVSGNTYTLAGFTVTAKRWNTDTLSFIYNTSGSATYLPGNVAGTPAINVLGASGGYCGQ